MVPSLPSNINITAPPCPLCSHQGIMVRDITVKSLLLPELKEKILENTAYYLCSDSDCNVSYYDIDANSIFEIKDVKVPIWYKKEANPIIACYCNKITKKEVINLVKTTGLTDMNEIIIHLRGKVKTSCVAKNPSGQCCNDFFNKIIEQGLNEKNP
ncbi:MAG TPA: (2Fe-2S)-binding protein [candidate division Zixibacteria bacterium]|nr:(2Fe-2S)-binding protein [candidate division Zixibacteria bacterium]